MSKNFVSKKLCVQKILGSIFFGPINLGSKKSYGSKEQAGSPHSMIQVELD